MQKSLKIYVVILVLLLAIIVVIDSNKPVPVNWTPTYGLQDKIPFGLYVFDNEVATLLKNDSVKKVNVSFYEYLEPFKVKDSTETWFDLQGTFLSISEDENLDNASSQALLEFVADDNTAFLSMKSFPKIILDSLKIELNNDGSSKDTITNWLSNKSFSKTKFKIVEGAGHDYFSKLDTINTTILGYQTTDSVRVNYVKVKYKNGNFLLHTQPTAFTNFNLLENNNDQYAANVLSYLPKQSIFWNTKYQNGIEVSQYPLRYIFEQPALKAAWFIFLGGMLIFMIFNAKRRQRIVPILVPESNTTVDFVKTIGNLYYQEGDHDNLMTKKIVYFLDKIRTKFMIETNLLDENFVKRLHQKLGKEINDIENVVYKIRTFQTNSNPSTETDLIALNSAIEKLNF